VWPTEQSKGELTDGDLEKAGSQRRMDGEVRLGLLERAGGFPVLGAARGEVRVDDGEDGRPGGVGEDAGKGWRRTPRPSRLRGLATEGAAGVDDDDDRRAADIARRRRRPHKFLANEKSGVMQVTERSASENGKKGG
jgi:hypothetical protein